jgi:uncharacterized protein YcbX
MRIGTIVGLWRYPVKSMRGERLDRARLSWRGIPGDRGWAVYDEMRGGVSGAKRLPRLRACGARYPGEPVAGEASPPVEIELPDGGRVTSDSPEAPRRLAELLGRPVSLRALGRAGNDAAPRVVSRGEPEDDVRALMGVLPDEPLPDMSAFPPERLRLLRQGNFFDALPIHLLTRTTLRTLARATPESAWDARRFRPNLLLEAEAREGYPEQAWIGRRVRAGTAVLEVVAGCPRCVMVTQPVDELPEDHRVMRTLVRETGHTAGIYASVVIEGEAAPGDAVELLDES